MTVNYTTLLGLAQPVTGTEANAWGDVVNQEITALVEEAVAGGETIDVTSGDVTLSTTVGAANQARNAILLITGTPGTSRNVVAPTQSKVYLVKNSSNAAIVLKGSATTGVTIPVGVEALCFFNGSDFEIVGVNGPASSTDNAIARFDSTTGKVIQNSGVTIDDSNNISGVAQLNATTVAATTVNATTADINGGTIDATTVGATTASTGAFTNLAYTGTLTGGTGVVNLGSGQLFKDANGNVGIGTSSPTTKLTIAGSANLTDGTLDIKRSAFPVVQLQQTGSTGVGLVAMNNDDFELRATTAHPMVLYTNNTERMRITDAGNVGIGTSSPGEKLDVNGSAKFAGSYVSFNNNGYIRNDAANILRFQPGSGGYEFRNAGNSENLAVIDSAGNVGIGTTAPVSMLQVGDTDLGRITIARNTASAGLTIGIIDFRNTNNSVNLASIAVRNDEAVNSGLLQFITTSAGASAERMRITSAGNVFFTKTASNLTSAGMEYAPSGRMNLTTATNLEPLLLNRQASDGTLIEFRQANSVEGSISVSGATVSYNAFSGGHWSQLQEGRGYNPDIPRGTVISTIGEMCEWKSVEWAETTEHPAIPAVEAKEAVLDEEGDVIEPAVEAVEGKDAWTKTTPHREAYLGQLPMGATFEEDGFTKTVIDDGNERLPKVKISDVVGDKAVYGVFQTWDEVEDMLVTSLGAFVVRIAAGVTVEIGDLLESNGDGCAKVQDDDVIRSKTIAKVTSTNPTATYDDGSYTVPAVIYCG